jgi:outer membrane scaffolding protein for murein synthesis (MipA/OmpV family)
MRTTLTLEPEVARRVESEIQRTRKTMKAVINDALKVGLGISVNGEPPSPYKVRAYDMGVMPGIDYDKLNQLADELEVEAYLEKERRDRS